MTSGCKLAIAFVVLLAGCVELPAPAADGNLTADKPTAVGQDVMGPIEGEHVDVPPISFVVNYQYHRIAYTGGVGGEGGNRWDNITIAASQGCHHDAPTTGPMVPGQDVKFSADSGVEQCTVTASYLDWELDAWVFTMEASE